MISKQNNEPIRIDEGPARTNIVLIGMPGVGKSTLGVVLAKMTGMDFLDVDLVIQKREGKTLQALIDENGAAGFIALENEVLCDIAVADTVIATGGSAVYSDEGLRRQNETGVVVYLQTSCESLESHLGNFEQRGVVMRDETVKNLRALYDERVPLYERFADITVDVEGLSITNAVRQLADAVQEYKRA